MSKGVISNFIRERELGHANFFVTITGNDVRRGGIICDGLEVN